MAKVSWLDEFFTSSVVLATFLRCIAQAAHMDSDLPTHVPSKLDEIPVMLPKSWPTVDPTYVPENISVEVVEGSAEVVTRLKSHTGYLWPKRKAHDFHNFERRQAGFATTNYCEYEGRYVRKGAEKYIPELDKIVVCRSVNPLWISVYLCNVVLKTPERYKDMTPRLLNKCTVLCEKKPGVNTKSPAGLPDWQVRMNNMSDRLKTEVYTTVSNRFYRKLKPLTPSSAATRQRSRTQTTQTPWDGEWDPKWNELKSRPVTMRREEAALRAAGLWFTEEETQWPTASTTPDRVRALLDKINRGSSRALEKAKKAAETASPMQTPADADADTDTGETFADFVEPKAKERPKSTTLQDGELFPFVHDTGKRSEEEEEEGGHVLGDYLDLDKWDADKEAEKQQDERNDEDDFDGDPYE